MSNKIAVTEKHSQTCTRKPLLSGIFRYASLSDIPLFALGSLLIILSAVASTMQTLLYGKIFDKLGLYFTGFYDSRDGFLSDLRVLIGAMMAIAGGRLFFAWIGIMVWLIVGENTQMKARTSLFESLINKDIEWLGAKENLIGSLTAFYRCIEEIRSGISENLGLLIQTIASVCCLFVIAMTALWSLTLIICCLIPLSTLSSWAFGSLTSKYATEENLKNAQASKILDWCFVSGESVRALNGKIPDLVKFGRVADASAVAFTKMACAISANSAVLKLLSNSVVLGGLAFGEYLVRTGKLDLGNVITAFSACVIFGTQISSVGDILALLNKAQASLNTIDQMELDHLDIDATPLVSSTSEFSSFSQKTPCQTLSVHNLTFRYKGTEANVVDGVDALFKLDHMNFIVGESGSGKSTLALLLAGFLESTAGEVTVDGIHYDHLSRDWFTDNVCFVELRPLIFERLLADNLLLGTANREDCPETRLLLLEAVAFADLANLVDQLPKKLDSVLDSTKLSGGQIQKIGLARAWMANRPILILDEALGSVNKKSKLKIMENIRKWRSGYLTVIITHDISDIQGLDSVISMEKSRVKASGSAHEIHGFLPKLKLLVLEDQSEEEGESISSEKALEEAFSYDYMNNPAILRDLELALGLQNMHSQIDKTEPMGLFPIIAFCFKTIEHKSLVLAGLVCSLLGGIATPGLSYCFAEVLSLIVKNSFLPSTGKHTVVTWSVIIVGVAVADLMASFGSHMSLQYALEMWILKLRKRCLARINDQDMSFFNTSKPSHLNTLLMNDTRDLRNLVSEFLSGVLLVISLTMLGLVWAIVIGWKLALVGMAFVPLIFLVTLMYGFLLQKYETAYKDHVAGVEKFSQEVVSAMRTVRSFGLAQQLSAEHQHKLSQLYRAGCKRGLAGGFGIALLELCITSATATVLYYGMYLTVKHEYNQRQMIQVLTMLTFTVASASYLMKLLPEITRGQRAGTLITRLLKLAELPVECDGTETRAKVCGNREVLAFKNVCFSYPDPQTHSYKSVLRDTSFTVNSGEALVLVGECGSGKSTIALLVMRLYQQDRGTITYLGKDIKEYDTEWYRRNVALVGQEPSFFEASVRENLLYGLSGSARATAETYIEESLAAVNALEFLGNLLDGLDTVLGTGCLFSLGQLQRLSIARVLVRRPKVILFDEPTSRLDAENTATTSSLIFRDLHQYDPLLTTIVISHDPRVMAEASRLLMVQHGKIIEEGTYDELLRKNGAFTDFMR